MTVTVPTLVLVLPLVAVVLWLYAVLVARPILRRVDRWANKKRDSDWRLMVEQVESGNRRGGER